LAALYTAAFALAVVMLGAATLATTRAALTEQFEARIAAEASALAVQARQSGLAGVRQAVRERDRTPGALEYGLRTHDGRPLEGRLAGVAAPPGWSTLTIPQADEDAERMRILARDLPGGVRLVVGDDLEPIASLDELLVRRFAWALAGVVVLGVAGGYGLSRGVHRRLAGISGAAEAIIDGDLSRRVPVSGSGDDLDRLAVTLNRMLDRIAALMESLRQVSNDIAHDLRTPLTRLRQRLEGVLAEVAEAPAAAPLEVAVADLDAALATFAALLRIAQIESGARRAGFRAVDLAEVVRTVVEAFTPAAQDAGLSLVADAPGPAPVDGDHELLTQMLANLVENGLRHTPAGTSITVSATGGARPEVAVRDNGPGVPQSEQRRLFDRFYRLERSRSTPGSGLGLSLVAAVARLHEATVTLEDGHPGLVVRAIFPGRATG
jgi:signal transduction histidine kinase